MKHTNGPWAAHVNEITETYEVQAVSVPMGQKHICNTDSLNVSHDVKKANAHLIAAAPEMLAALEAIVKAGMVGRDVAIAQDLARKVIAKAKGE